MQKLIEKINSKVEDFIEQRQNLVMVLSCLDNEAAMIMKIINDIELSNGTDAFFFFADDFVDQESYVAEIIDKLYLQVELANQEAEKENLDLLPTPPSELKNGDIPPKDRLGRAMIYTRSLLPEIGSHHVIWVLYPQNIKNRKYWHDLISYFAPTSGLHDGMQGLRIIFRDLPKTLDLSPKLSESPRIQFDLADMSPKAIDKALEETINDDSTPDEQRFDSMLQKAMIDVAHSRLDQAYDAFKYMFGYYKKTKNYAVQAVIINSIGDIHKRKNELDTAHNVFESATEPSIKSNSATILHHTTLNLAESEFARKNFPQAEKYYEQVDALATKMLYADGKLHALNRKAECFIQQDDWDTAVQVWEEAASFCRAGDYTEDLEIELQYLLGAKKHLKQEALNAYEKELHHLTGKT